MTSDDIAIIGVGLRFPGGATSTKELWRVLSAGESKWSPFPHDRLNVDGYYHPSGDRQGSISFRGAHFLDGDISAFDSSFFSITADEARAIDPQQRMLLEVCFEAMDNAGIKKEAVDGSDTAVYIGSFVKDYEQICLRDPDWQPKYAATGNGMAIMANRISYAFNFHGPSMTIDTGCSGSLVSVHLGAQSLRNQETSMAIVGGVGLILTPSTIMPMTALNFLSPDGKCFTFDSRANGYGRGEGIGIIVMKRLSDALRDGDPVRAVIRGSAVNQDGKTTGITLPSKEAQVANIKAVYTNAGLTFDQTAYVECHGTGTPAGDWRELKAISETMASGRPLDDPIIVGSLKPNIGHLEGAAGVAGVIKGILVLERGMIPPNINFREVHPDINLDGWRVRIPMTLLDWPKPGIRRVSVNCFGFGGTNAHVIMDEAPRAPNRPTPRPESSPRLFQYSSHDKPGIARLLQCHIRYLESVEKKSTSEFLRDYAYTLACRRSMLEWRIFFVAETVPQLLSSLKDLDQHLPQRFAPNSADRVCLLFGGQGTQWSRMGVDLMRFEQYRLSIWEASYYLKTRLGSPYDLLGELLRPEARSRLSRPEISQPATTAVQVALVELLASFGVQPSHVIGHSSGEIAAAFAAGALSREDAWEIAYYRGMVTATLPILVPGFKGEMIVVGMSHADVETYLRLSSASAEVACINSSQSVTLSGHDASIRQIANDLKKKSIFHRVLGVGTAYHSSHMRPVELDYKALIRHIRPRNIFQETKMFSSVTGKQITGSELNAEYWSNNLVSPVLFLAAIKSLMASNPSERPNVLLELSPRPALRSATLDVVSRLATKLAQSYYPIMDIRSRETKMLLQTMGHMWSQGFRLDIQTIMAQGTKRHSSVCLTDLPPYPWNHDKSHWHESHLDRAIRFRKYPRQDLIGAPTPDSTLFEGRWRGFIRISENPWLQDHQIQKTIIYPAAGMISMVFEGAKQIATAGSEPMARYEIADMKVEMAMVIPHTAHGLEVTMHMRVAVSGGDMEGLHAPREFSIYSKPLDKPWERHATGILRFRRQATNDDAILQFHTAQLDRLIEKRKEAVIPRQLYEELDVLGINYGPLFQNIVELHNYGNACVSQIRTPDTQSCMPSGFEYPHLIHPTALDSMFQTLFSVKPVPMVPVFIKHLSISAGIKSQAASIFQGYSTACERGIQGAEGTFFMRQQCSSVSYVRAHGIYFTKVPPVMDGFLPNHHNLSSEIIWKEDTLSPIPADLGGLVARYAHKHPSLKVLQVGGSPSIARTIFDAVMHSPDTAPALSRYTIVSDAGCDLSLKVTEVAKNLGMQDFIETRDIASMGAMPVYHVIVASTDPALSYSELAKHLHPGGIILLEKISFKKERVLEPSGTIISTCNIFEPGTVNTSRSTDGSRSLAQRFNIHRSPLQPKQVEDLVDGLFIIRPDRSTPEITSMVTGLRKAFQIRQAGVTVSELNSSQVLHERSRLSNSIVISMLDISGANNIFHWNNFHFEMFRAVYNSARGIVWLTRGANMTPDTPEAAPIIALARTLQSEDPLRKVVTIDLATDTDILQATVIDSIVSIIDYTFGRTSLADDEPLDTEFALGAGSVFIPRLHPITLLNRLIEGHECSRVVTAPFGGYHQGDIGLSMEPLSSDMPDNGLRFIEFGRSKPGPDEVEVLFEEAPLTTADLNTIMGRSGEKNLGRDILGRIGRVGESVRDFRPGDRVCSLLPTGGAFSSAISLHKRWVKKHQIGFIPSLHVSAYYGLIHVSRIAARKRVLVHFGASAAGLAAIDICLIQGAEIFATIGGSESEQQRLLLLARDLLDDHIIDIGVVHLVEVIQSMTQGQGVHAVYNANASGAYQEADFECVRSSGTVIYLTDKLSSATPSFRVSVKPGTVLHLDLRQLAEHDSGFAADLLERAAVFVARHSLSFMVNPGAKVVFGIHSIQAALRHIEQSPNVGYVTISASNPHDDKVLVRKEARAGSLREALDRNGVYVLAGGLGGLGRSISELLVSNGVRHLVFLSRSDITTKNCQPWITDLQGRGVSVQVYNVDICDAVTLKEVVEEMSAQGLPIRGIFQCAAVIKDAVFDNMTWSDWITAFRPKTLGTRNLVQTLEPVAQDAFFVFLSSSAGVIGNRGQANYSAGNCFLDCMARSLRLRGKHAVSIDLGPVLGAGMLSEDDATLDKLRASGFYGIRQGDFLEIVAHAITMEIVPGVPMPAQVVLGVGTGGIFRQNKPADPYWFSTAMYSYLNLVDMPPPDLSQAGGDSSSGPQSLKSQLACCMNRSAAVKLITAGLVGLLAKSMTMLPEEVDANKSPSAYGVDSLVAVGIRNWVLHSCNIQVSVFEVLSDLTIAELAASIVKKGSYGQVEESGL